MDPPVTLAEQLARFTDAGDARAGQPLRPFERILVKRAKVAYRDSIKRAYRRAHPVPSRDLQ